MFNKELTAIELHKTQKLLAKISARALVDADFKAQLVADPVRVFEENGIYFAERRQVQVLQNTEETYYFVLPTDPRGLSDADAQSYTSMVGEGGNSSLDTGGPRCTKP